MNINEKMMADRGSDKIWKTVKDKDGNLKKVSNTQVGQQLIMDEAIRILPQISDWVKNGSSKVDRVELRDFFTDDDIILEKIVQTFLLLVGSIYTTQPEKRWRHKEVMTLSKKVLPELTFEIVWRFIEVIVDYSEYFDVEKELKMEGKQYKWRIKYTCNLSEAILSKIAASAIEAFFPLPMLTPPKTWSFENNEIQGGYDTQQYEMVISTTNDINYNKFSDKIFKSINYIQSIPWEVNKDLLEQVKQDLKIPKKEDYVNTVFPDMAQCEFNIKLKDENLKISERQIEKIENARAVFKDKIEVYNAECKEYESAVGKYRNSKMAIEIADQYLGKTIYFPHFYDFRGRIYPLSVGLSPQGSDLVKSLLEYKNGETLNKVGSDWCWAYMASLYGDDKLPFKERILRGMELLHVDYTEADEPYQFLAHQIEMRKYVEDTDREVKIRIHLDACNSGSQFTSAITGDKAGCYATNVIPTINNDGSFERKDAYLLVANKALELTNLNLKEFQGDDDELKNILLFIKQQLIKNGRKLCKRPVMVSNYGGTNQGRVITLADMFIELKLDRKQATRRCAYVLSKIIGDSIVGVLTGGKMFETYIQKMNSLIVKSGLPVTWNTKDGFHVVHFKNKELKRKQVNCKLPGSRKRITIIKKVYSKKPNGSKMRSAISPNYIHSLDAELLRMVALRMEQEGIKNSDWIHDSFGCHPNNVDKMLQITKEEFLNLIYSKPLQRLDDELRGQIPDTKASEKLLKGIKLPDLGGVTIENGDFNALMNSVWFFS